MNRARLSAVLLSFLVMASSGCLLSGPCRPDCCLPGPASVIAAKCTGGPELITEEPPVQMLPAPRPWPPTGPAPGLPPHAVHHPGACLHGCTPLQECLKDKAVLFGSLEAARQDLTQLEAQKSALSAEKAILTTKLAELSEKLQCCDTQVTTLGAENKAAQLAIQRLTQEKAAVAGKLDVLAQSMSCLQEKFSQKETQLAVCQEQLRCLQQQQCQLQQLQLTQQLLAEKDMKMKEVQLESARQQALAAYQVLAASKSCCPPCGPVITDMSKTTVPHGPCPITPFNTPITDQAKASDQAKTDQSKPDQSKVDQGKADQAKSDQGKVDQSKIDQSRTDQSKTDQSQTDQSKSDQSKSDQSKTDLGKTDQAKTVTPSTPNGVGGAAAAGGGGAAAGGGSSGSGGGLGGLLGLGMLFL